MGETENSIRSRFSQRKHNITTRNKDTVVSKHFNQTNHNLSMLRISVFQCFTENPKNSRKTDFMRKKYELLWINKLHTYTPIGLNIVTHLKSTNIPLILKYSNSASQLLRQVKNTLSNDTTYPNKFSITSSFTHHKKFSKHFSTYKILMFNFYSLYPCLPIVPLLSLSLSACLPVSLSPPLQVPYPFRTLVIMVLHNFLSLVVLSELYAE